MSRLALTAVLVAAVAPAPAAAAPASLLRTSDAEGVAVDRVAVRASRDGDRLRVQAFFAGRALDTAPLRLTLRVARCDGAARHCATAAVRPVVVAPSESRAMEDARIAPPRRDGTLVVTLGHASLRLVLPATAWAGSDPAWYGLKTPEAAWGSDVYRAVAVTGRAGPAGAVRARIHVRVALPGTPPLDGLVGTLGAAGTWTAGARAAIGTVPGAVAGGDPGETLDAAARLRPPFRAAGYGLWVTSAGTPVMVVWLPPPTAA